MSKKVKIIIIAASTVGLVILLLGIYFLVGFCVPPSKYTLRVVLESPFNSENPFYGSDTYKIGDKVCITAFLFNTKHFYYQKILYADSGPIYCTVTIQTEGGIEEYDIKLLTTPEYMDLGKDKDIESVPYTTISIEKMSRYIYYYKYAVVRNQDIKFEKPGIYTIKCYAAFQQIGKNYYVEQSEPNNEIVITVTED